MVLIRPSSIAANLGYHIVDVVVDGVSKGVQASWTFVNVQTEHTIAATFAINTYTITVTAGANGGISPGTGFVNYGATPTYTITPHVGYHIASITVNGLPVAVNTPAGQSYQFSAVSADGSIGATFAINTGSTGSADLVVRGADNTVYYRSYDFASDTWGGWVGLPGSTLDSPAAVVCGNELHIVVRGMDGESLYHGYVDLNSNVFSGWSWISGTTPSPPTLASNGNVVALVVRGADNSVYYCVYSVQARSWGDWRVFASGSTCDKVAAVMEGDVLTVVVRGYSASDLSAQNSLWQASVNVVSGVFSGWSWIPGSVTSSPTLAAWQNGNGYCMVVRGSDNSIYINQYTDGAWQGWAGLPDGSTYESPAATMIGDNLYVIVVGMDGTTLWQSNLDLNTKSFSGWHWISGTTPSKPTLTS